MIKKEKDDSNCNRRESSNHSGKKERVDYIGKGHYATLQLHKESKIVITAFNSNKLFFKPIER